MSRKLLAFLLSELATVRVICPKCNSALELTVEQMGYRLDARTCPVCHIEWQGLRAEAGDSRLSRLAKAIKAIQDAPDAPAVEFVLPDTDE